MNHKNGKENNNVKQQTCPLCGGTGKVSGKRDDTDICGFDSENAVCPLCHGSGKFKRRRCYLHIHRHCRLKKIPLKKPRLGRGGRPSLGKNVLLQPGTPTRAYSEVDMISESQREVGTAQQQSQFDIDNGSADLTSQENLPGELLQDQTADEMKITNTTSDSSENLQPCNSGPKESLQPGLDIPALLQQVAAMGFDSFPLAPDDYREDNQLNIPGPPGTLPESNEQLLPAPPSLIPPALGIHNPQDPLDITGIPDPAGFHINTDVEGITGV